MNSTLVILEKINSFYSSAFSQLITITVSMIAFVGIVIPVLFFLYQQRLFRIEVSSIEAKINTRLSEIKNELTEVIKNNIDEKIKEVRTSLANDNHELTGGLFLVQGIHYVANSRIFDAIESYINAGENYIKCKDELNLRTVIDNIKHCLPKVEHNKIKNAEEIEKNFNNFISLLATDLNKNGAYTKEISDLKSEFKKAKDGIKA